MPTHPHSSKQLDTFESTTRQIRWFTIAIVLITFPFEVSHAAFVYIALLAASLYNLLRYVKSVYTDKVLGSPALMLAVDCVFAGLLIAFVGGISTPYSAFLVFMIVSAAYLYQMPGVLLVVLGEAAMLYYVSTMPPFAPVELGQVRIIVLTIYALLAFGYMVSRLTQYDRQERLALEKLRRKSEQENSRLMTLVNSLNNAIIVTNDHGKIIQYNEAARILAGSKSSLQGKELDEVMPVFRRSDPHKKAVDIFDTTVSAQHRRDLSIMTPDNTQIDLDISVTPVEVSGKATEYILVCEDISKERSLEEQRTGFISVVSHELRTPLTILEAALSSVQRSKDPVPVGVQPVIDQAYRSTVQLSEMVRDLTVLAQAQNDNLPVSLAQIHAKQMLEQCIGDFTPQAEQRGLTLRLQVDAKTPSVLSTESHIREILQNYINNALKYSEKGTVVLAAEPAKNGGILFSVKDNGIGISLGDQKHLFTKFFRAENYLTQNTGGTGLGLYLCMELADRMGAKVWAKSEPGNGSTFFLEIPPQSMLKRDQSEVVTAEVANLVDGI